MRVAIDGGVRLWFDVEGLGLVPEGAVMRRRPSLVLLHGGPGVDHSTFKPTFSALTDWCQVIYYDHRGNGRSDRRTPDEWTLDIWADDVVRFCDALDIERPIVLGNSFGGLVAIRYAARHRDHPGRLVLSSAPARVDVPQMAAMFERLGGRAAAEAATAFWTSTDPTTLGLYSQLCTPLYTQTKSDPFARAVGNSDVALHFIHGEQRALDLFPDLGRIQCPTLVLAGGLDPVCPLAVSEEMAATIGPLATLKIFPSSGHGVFRDEPEQAISVLREFLTEDAGTAHRATGFSS